MVRLEAARLISAGQRKSSVSSGLTPTTCAATDHRSSSAPGSRCSTDRGMRRGSGNRVEAADFRSAGRAPCAAATAVDGLRTGAAEHHAPAEDAREQAAHNVRADVSVHSRWGDGRPDSAPSDIRAARTGRRRVPESSCRTFTASGQIVIEWFLRVVDSDPGGGRVRCLNPWSCDSG
jgi:hypothetical protein